MNALETRIHTFQIHERAASEARLDLWAKSRKKTNPVKEGMKQSVGLWAVGANRKWQFYKKAAPFLTLPEEIY